MSNSSLLGLFGVLREVGLAVIYLGGAITCLVLGLRKAGTGAWLGLGAFGVLLCDLVTLVTINTVVLPQASQLNLPIMNVMLAQSCCNGGLAALAALLLIASLVMLARQRTTTPASFG
jgi:hypothetical protein